MRQLIKFCIVGASSTVIDKGIQWILMGIFPLVPWWLIQSVSFCFGVTNGFIWNRHWTFAGQNNASARTQYSKFFATNVIGLGLNLLMTKGFLVLFTGKMIHAVNPGKTTVLLASLCAIPIVVIWNFGASRLWTFRAHTPNSEAPAMDANVPPIASPKH